MTSGPHTHAVYCSGFTTILCQHSRQTLPKCLALSRPVYNFLNLHVTVHGKSVKTVNAFNSEKVDLQEESSRESDRAIIGAVTVAHQRLARHNDCGVFRC
jgi:hypothetical protein